MTARTRTLVTFMLIGASAACWRISSAPRAAPQLWLPGSPRVITADTAVSGLEGGIVVLDSASFRPVLLRGGNGIATFTNYQGTRYHPEAVRAIVEDPSVIDTFSGAVVRALTSAGKGVLLDLQGMSPSDLPRLIDLVRAIGNRSRAASLSPVGIIIPAGDTLAYPAPMLARVADIVVIRLGSEHRPGTSPGPLATPEFIARELGSRAIGLGASRLAAEFPLYGYLWNRDGSARIITYRDANNLVLHEAGVFNRDPASQYLTASGRDGWTIWIPDARTVARMIDAARGRGVNIIALTGIAGADPAIGRGTAFKR